MTPEEYLKLPYSRCFVPDGDAFSAYMLEFQGCYTEGDTLEEAYENLQVAACNWLEASIAAGHTIPQPVDNTPKMQRMVVGCW